MYFFGIHIATITAVVLTVYFAVLAAKMATDPEAPPPIKFIFAGIPLLLGILAVSCLLGDLELLGP